MLFNSLTFAILHFLILAAYWLTPIQRIRVILLALGSFVFYGWLYWPGLFFIATVIVINYLMAIKIEQTSSRKWLIFAIGLNLLNLGYFKYINFFARSTVDLLQLVHIELYIPAPEYWLPLGISFITFQKIAYLVDVYNKKTSAEKSLIVFSCFAAFYGQLIAGPIVRSNEFLPQLHTRRTFSGEWLQLGVFYFIAGLMIKVTVADTLAQFVDYGFSHTEDLSTKAAWFTLYAFSIQILCDFWGYSSIALGCAYMLGIRLPINFNLPYGSNSLTEFWKRWHITLSSWLRDYLYIPLGGNRTGKTYRNLIATMTLGGLWHGASWNFVIWGFLNGLWLATERRLGGGKQTNGGLLVRLAKGILVFHGVCLLWVFFRAQTLTDSIRFFEKLLLPPYDFSSSVPSTLTTIVILFFLFYRSVGQYLVDDRFLALTLRKQLLLTITAMLLILTYSQARLDFIYFVF